MALEDLSYGDYWNTLKRRWGFVLLGGATGLAVGVALARTLVPAAIFQATATVRFDPGQGFEVGRDDKSGTLFAEQSTFIYGAAVLGGAAKRLGWLPPDTPPARYEDDYSPLYRVARQIRVALGAQQTNTGLLELKATASSPDQAARIANAVSNAYQDADIDLLRTSVRRRRDFVQRQLGANEHQMNEAQLAYELFRRKHPAAANSAGLGRFIASLEAAEGAERTLIAKINEARNQLALVRSGRPVSDLGIQAIVGGDASARLTKLSLTYTDLRLARSALLTELTDAHPRVIQLDEQTASLRDELRDELELLVDAFEQQQAEQAIAVEEMQARENEELGIRAQEAMQIAQLARRVKILENVALQLRSELEDSLIKEAGVAGRVKLIAPAVPPLGPVTEPQLALFGSLGLLSGLFAGYLVGLLIEASRFSWSSLRALEESLDLDVLGVCTKVTPETFRESIDPSGPAPGSDDWNRGLGLAIFLAPHAALSESFRTLRVNLEPATRSGGNAFAVASTSTGEGATTAALSLAFGFAQTGRSVALVETNFRRPSLARLFDLDPDPGLGHLILGEVRLDEALRTTTDLLTGHLSLDHLLAGPGADRLHVIPAGRPELFPGEPFDSHRFREVLAELQSRYDLVILDTAAREEAIDSVVLGRTAHLVLVHDPDKTDRSTLAAAVSEYRKSDCDLVGLFVNGVTFDAGPGDQG